MKRYLTLCLSSVLLATGAMNGLMAQSSTPTPKTYWEADAAVGIGKSLVTTALGGTRWHRLGRSGRLQLGYGLRLTGAFGGAQDFITAPAELSRESDAFLLTLFSPFNEANLDTLQVPNSTVLMLNATGHVRYQLSTRWAVGFNIDVVGVSFGSVDAGNFVAQSQGRPTSVESAKPSGFNLLLIGDNDRGSLNSELYVHYQLSERWGLRAGISHLFVEATTNRTLSLGNDRFRRVSDLGFVSATYRF